MFLVATQQAQQASSGLSGWEQLGIVVAGSLMAAAIIGLFSWARKPAHRVHVAEFTLRAQVRDFDEDDPADAPSHVLKMFIEVTNTGDIPLDVMLHTVVVTMDGNPVDETRESSQRHQIVPGQHQTFRGEAPFEPHDFGDDLLGSRGPESVSVFFQIDYGRPIVWWFRRRITSTHEAKIRRGFFSPPYFDPAGRLTPLYAPGGSPRDTHVWPWSR